MDKELIEAIHALLIKKIAGFGVTGDALTERAKAILDKVKARFGHEGSAESEGEAG